MNFRIFSFLAALLLIFGAATYENKETIEFRYQEHTASGEEQQLLIPVINSDEKIYIYAKGKVATLNAAGIRYHHTDYIGSSVILTDSSGIITYETEYYPFGALLRESGISDKYSFAGKELDKTNLQYFGARYYDQDSGRFTQRDPIGPGYAYANNNPLRFVDPDGKQAVETLQQTVRQSPEVMVEELMRTWRTIPPQARITCVLAICGFALASFGNPMFMHNQIGPLSLAETTQSDSLQVGEAASSLDTTKRDIPDHLKTRAEKSVSQLTEEEMLSEALGADVLRKRHLDYKRDLDIVVPVLILNDGRVVPLFNHHSHLSLTREIGKENVMCGGYICMSIDKTRVTEIQVGGSGVDYLLNPSLGTLKQGQEILFDFARNGDFKTDNVREKIVQIPLK